MRAVVAHARHGYNKRVFHFFAAFLCMMGLAFNNPNGWSILLSQEDGHSANLFVMSPLWVIFGLHVVLPAINGLRVRVLILFFSRSCSVHPPQVHGLKIQEMMFGLLFCIGLLQVCIDCVLIIKVKFESFFPTDVDVCFSWCTCMLTRRSRKPLKPCLKNTQKCQDVVLMHIVLAWCLAHCIC